VTEVVVVGVDGSEAGARAARFAAGHLSSEGGQLVVAHVIPWSPYAISTAQDNEERPVRRRAEIAAGEAILAPLLAELGAGGPSTVGVVRHGHPAETLVTLVQEHGATHVVVGRVGQSRVGALLFGSTPSHLIQTCPVPVTVVP